MKRNLPKYEKPHRRKRRQVIPLDLPPLSLGKPCNVCGENSTYCVHKREDGKMVCENCYRKKNVSDITKQKKWIWEHKASHGCLLCDEDDPKCLDYHHVKPEKKKFSIGSMSSSIPDKAVIIEMKKCVVLCSNCHRKVEVVIKHNKKQKNRV